MFKKIIENLVKETKTIYGERRNGDKCAFCGETLAPGEYCYCPDALKINPFYKRINKKYDELSFYLSDEEYAKANLKGIFAASNVPIKYRGGKFDDYIEHDSTDAKVKKLVVNYFNDAMKNYLTGKNLILIGNPGTGKTMLMSILVENLIRDYAFKVRYANCVELINQIQDTYSSVNQKTTLSVLNQYRDADFLFIDDLDKINATVDSKKLIYSIINDRYDRVLPTVISANSSIEVLDEKYFDEPTVSRFLENSVEVSFTQKNKRI